VSIGIRYFVVYINVRRYSEEFAKLFVTFIAFLVHSSRFINVKKIILEKLLQIIFAINFRKISHAII